MNELTPEETVKMLDYTKNEIHIKIWNAAIETAAREAELWMDETVPTRIRNLKK